jgi:hypothetical protein
VSIFEQLRSLDDADEPRSLVFGSSGLPLWPFIRWTAVSAATEQALGLQTPFADVTRRTLRQTAELVARSQLRGPLSSDKRDIAIVGSSAGIVIKRAGRWFDRINDYFAVVEDSRTLVLDRAGADGYKTPRFPAHVRCYDGFDIRAGIVARVRRPGDADVAAIERLLGFLRDKVPGSLTTAVLERLRAHLVHYAVRLPILRDLWAKFFERVQPKVLFVEDGSYGAYAHLFTWARAAGIATAEFQHGVISRSHLAYNIGDAARTDDRYARCIPQHLLLYGDVYARETRTSSELTVVGCPHFSETVTAASGAASTVLFVSQGTRTDAMVTLASAIAKRFPKRSIVFRPHPGELAFPERYASLRGMANIDIDERGDIYDRFRSAAVVIGHSSTAIVEAAGMGLPVLVLDDAAARAILPADVGTWFRDADELADLVTSPPRRQIEPAQFFAPDWRERYRAFIARVTLGGA